MTHPKETSDDMLMALADGELNDADARQLQRVIAADPVLAARYADFVATRQMVRDAYPPEPVPDRLVAAVMGQGNVVPLRRPMARQAGWGLALAASLVLVLGGFWAGRSTGPQTGGQIDLAQVTADLLTGEERTLPDGSTARILGSYATAQGLCRLIAQEAQRHVLCRDAQAGDWAVALSVTTGDAGQFLPASDTGTGLIDRLLDDLGAGPALDIADERAALLR